MSTVAVVRCPTYETAVVRDAVRRGVDLLGGAGRFAKQGEKILLKLNMLVGDDPERSTTTHPAVFEAVAELFAATGARLACGDSPAVGTTRMAARGAGIAEAAARLGIELRDFQPGREVTFAEGLQNKKFTIAEAVLESDGVISLPKFKTHGFQKITGAVKLQFGCIPGLLKGEFHVRLPDALSFARMLVDLDRLVCPRLYVMDAVVSMEGNGPRGGTPRALGALLFAADPIALDATACRLIDLEPTLVPTVAFGQEAGRGTHEQGRIELLGDALEPLVRRDFVVDRTPVRPYREQGLRRFLSNHLVPKPVIDHERCVRCGVCTKVCPVRPPAVDWPPAGRSRPPVHDYRRCIRCYCCQELCPEKAISLSKPLLRRALGPLFPGV